MKSLYLTRIFQNDSPTRNLRVYFIDLFVTQNILIPGTLVNQIVDMSISPGSLIFPGCMNSSQLMPCDGLSSRLTAIHVIQR